MESKWLWFGDERGYNATVSEWSRVVQWLWFGDERGYNATQETIEGSMPGCGLVMKEDITQPKETEIFLSHVVVW